MNRFYQTKGALKQIRWRGRRAVVALRFGTKKLKNTPALLGNAIPKAGSHLIIQILLGLTRVGPFVNPGFPPVSRAEDNSKLSGEETFANIQRMRPGDIRLGYVPCREPFVSALTGPGRAMVFVYRDPRDVIVSSVIYATDMYMEHGMHTYYTQQLHSMEQRINAEIHGVTEPGFEFPDVRSHYERYLGWLEQPGVLPVRFEELILDRHNALGRIVDYMTGLGVELDAPRSQVIDILKDSIAPRKSDTFRKGQPGGWTEHFTEANKAAFKEVASDLLIKLGYEQGYDW